jgi:predicted NBD/HSP70 family sugar kinase
MRCSEKLGLPAMGPGSLSCKEVFERAADGDQACVAVVDETCMYIALACINIVRFFDCEVIILGGGMTLASNVLLAGVRRHFEKLHWSIDPPRCEIRLAALGTDAGIFGAAACAFFGGRSIQDASKIGARHTTTKNNAF